MREYAHKATVEIYDAARDEFVTEEEWSSRVQDYHIDAWLGVARDGLSPLGYARFCEDARKVGDWNILLTSMTLVKEYWL